MSENTPSPRLPQLDEVQLQKIAGGDCTLNDVISGLEELKSAYESLIDFTSYVIERVVTSSTT